MTKETKNNGHPEGGIYELFAYTPKLLAYPNNSHMNELGVIGDDGLKNIKRQNNS